MRNAERYRRDGDEPRLVLVKNDERETEFKDFDDGTYEEDSWEEEELPEGEEADYAVGDADPEDYDPDDVAPEDYDSEAYDPEDFEEAYGAEDEEWEEDSYPEYDGEAGEYDEYDEYDEYGEDDYYAEYDGEEPGAEEPGAAPPSPGEPSGEEEGGKKAGDGQETTARARKKGFFRKHLKLIIFLLILLIAGGIGAFLFFKNKKAKEVSMMPTQSFSPVERMDISNSVAVTGTISAKKVRNVSTLVSNTKVKTVSVEVGDYVKEGDPICTFDTTNIEEKIARLQKQIYVAASKSNLSRMEANTKLAWTLEDGYYSEQEKLQRIEAARRSYDAAERDLGEKEKQLEEAQEKYDDKDSDENEKSLRQAKLAVASAKDQVQSAIDSYNDAVRAEITNTNNTVRTVSQNQESILQAGLDGMTTNDSSNTELDELNRQLRNCVVTAPISGLITSVSVEVGEEYSEKSTICVIQDDSVYLVKGTVDQYDIARMNEGLSAVIKTEATGDEELEGTVTFVAPVPQSSSTGSGTTTTTTTTTGSGSTAAYSVEIMLKKKDDRLRLGMTAETSVLTEKRENVLAVPYDCVTEENGENVVYVAVNSGEPQADEEFDDGSLGPGGPGEGGRPSMPEGADGGPGGFSIKAFITDLLHPAETEMPEFRETKRVAVEKGLETDYYIEVISDELKEGDEVLVSASSDSSDFGFGFGGPPGGFF